MGSKKCKKKRGNILLKLLFFLDYKKNYIFLSLWCNNEVRNDLMSPIRIYVIIDINSGKILMKRLVKEIYFSRCLK